MPRKLSSAQPASLRHILNAALRGCPASVQTGRMRVFGLTGGVGSGKSTVAGYFRQSGVPVIDADELARVVVAPGSAALLELCHHFGPELLTESGELDRAWLGKRIFQDPSELAIVNQIVHPRVAQLFQERRRELELSGHTLVGYEVPLLFENGLDRTLRPVVVVTAPLALQKSRAMQRSGWSREHTEARIRAQLPLADKLARADYVIDNGGTLQQTYAQADAVLARLRAP
jgi:dephospho-CoA kinase